jgi:hypothetical protein
MHRPTQIGLFFYLFGTMQILSPPRGLALRSLRAKLFSFGSICAIRGQKKHVRRSVF